MIKDLNYTFTCTAAPVQAEGTINDKAFYFRSRHEHWSFSVSDDPSVDPVDIQSLEQGFFIEKEYGTKSFDASYMPLDEAKRIIENCAEMFLSGKTD